MNCTTTEIRRSKRLAAKERRETADSVSVTRAEIDEFNLSLNKILDAWNAEKDRAKSLPLIQERYRLIMSHPDVVASDRSFLARNRKVLWNQITIYRRRKGKRAIYNELRTLMDEYRRCIRECKNLPTWSDISPIYFHSWWEGQQGWKSAWDNAPLHTCSQQFLKRFQLWQKQRWSNPPASLNITFSASESTSSFSCDTCARCM